MNAKLRRARAEIEALMKRDDLAGTVSLYDMGRDGEPDSGVSFLELTPSYSTLVIEGFGVDGVADSLGIMVHMAEHAPLDAVVKTLHMLHRLTLVSVSMGQQMQHMDRQLRERHLTVADDDPVTLEDLIEHLLGQRGKPS